MSSRSTEVQETLRKFNEHYDALLYARVEYFNHHLERFVTFLERDHLVQSVLQPLIARSDISVMRAWLDEQIDRKSFQIHLWSFPKNQLDELVLRFYLLKHEASGQKLTFLDLVRSHESDQARTEQSTSLIQYYSRRSRMTCWEILENSSTIPSVQHLSASLPRFV